MLENICSAVKYSLNLVTVSILCPYNLVIRIVGLNLLSYLAS